MTSSAESYNTRMYKCHPWYGEAGSPFTQVFKPDFLAAMAREADEFANLRDHLLQKDYGSPNNPHPGTAAVQLKSQIAYELRISKCISMMRAHTENTELKKVIDQMTNNPPPNPGMSLAVIIWHRMESEGTLQSSLLQTLNEDNDWINLKLTQVGLTERTMRRARTPGRLTTTSTSTGSSRRGKHIIRAASCTYRRPSAVIGGGGRGRAEGGAGHCCGARAVGSRRRPGRHS